MASVRIPDENRTLTDQGEVTGYLATLGYLFPVLRRNLMPLMQKRGQKAKAVHRRRFAVGGGPP